MKILAAVMFFSVAVAFIWKTADTATVPSGNRVITTAHHDDEAKGRVTEYTAEEIESARLRATTQPGTTIADFLP
jgi:hypothetical protein